MENKQFLEKEIPFLQFQKLGISKVQWDSMPKEIKDPLLKGELTPLIQKTYQGKALKNGKENAVTLRMRLGLVRDSNGQVQLYAYPVYQNLTKALQNLKQRDLELTAAQIRQLEKGETIKKTAHSPEGKLEKIFIQLDKETSRPLLMREKDAAIPNAINGVELGREQKERLREGKPLELVIGDSKITAGVDLAQGMGFNVIKGDAEQFEKMKAIKWDMDNPGAVGFWNTSENNWEYMMAGRQNTMSPEDNQIQRQKNSQESRQSSGFSL